MKEPAAPLKKSRAPPPKQRQRKKKTKEPEWAEIQRETSEWFKKQAEEKKAREMEPPPVNRRDLNFFIRMEGAKNRIPLLSNYERALVKADEKDKRKGKSSSSGAIPDLRHLSKKYAQRPRWPYELGKPLVRPSLVRKLSTKMYAFHQWYMMAFADSREMFGLKVKPIDFYGEGEKVLWLDFKDIYEVYHHDALDIPLISAWTCRREAYLHIGFMDPSVVNKKQIQISPEKTLVEVYNSLDKQTCYFHWILIIIEPERSHITVFDSLRNDPVDAWKQFIRTHKGPFKEKLTWNTDFPIRMKSAHLLHCITRIFHNLFFSALKCLRQEPGNNLCGYYIYEHMHSFMGPKGLKMMPHNFKEERVEAICEGLIGFLMDKVVNPKGEFYYDGRQLDAPSSNTSTGKL
uniref:Ubiquitin-like protease family profile domain-containing protein n=1 Tax=Setaria viridis TaxID=4556 RepID=A0A4U6TR76_SETVI|nr:hypothetical protein SEVIR_8G083900v2 [Setaria viridis]